MMEQMVNSVVEKRIKANYQHIKLPSCVYAKITKVSQNADHYVYNLKILDENKILETL